MSAESSIQHKAPFKTEAGFAFENERPVGVTDFAWDEIERPSAELNDFILGIQTETQRRILGLLLDGNADVQDAGMRVHLLAFGLGLHPAQSQIALAASLGISQSAVSKGIISTCKKSTVFGRFWASLGRQRRKME